MGFHSVRFFHFRNVEEQTVEIDSPRIFLVGENGQGKTNFLEALYLLSYGTSFRTHRDAELVTRHAKEMSLEGSYADDEQEARVTVQIEGGKKSIRLDGNAVRDRREMVSRIPCVLFRHDDLKYVAGPPELQRFFVDQTLSMFQPLHIDDLRRYRRVLNNRNQALKNRSLDLLDVLDSQLAAEALQVQRNRNQALGEFNAVFAELFRPVSTMSGDLAIEYQPSGHRVGFDQATEDDFVEAIRARRSQELTMGTTVLGPHRDKILFRYDGTDFLEVASTGQQRLTALILRVSQARLFAARTRRRPVLLLDDVLLELDAERRTRFVATLPEAEQLFFTFLPGELFESYRSEASLVYSVESGRFIAA